MLKRLLGLLNSYVYELREHDMIVSTGRLTLERPPERDKIIDLNGRPVRIADVTVRDGQALVILEAEPAS